MYALVDQLRFESIELRSLASDLEERVLHLADQHATPVGSSSGEMCAEKDRSEMVGHAQASIQDLAHGSER